jgi:anti-sigma factor RsiW
VIDCSTAVRQLWDFIEQDLNEEDQTLVEEHLAFCRRCCGEVEFAEELRTFLKSAARPLLPEDAEARLSEFIDTIEESP